MPRVRNNAKELKCGPSHPGLEGSQHGYMDDEDQREINEPMPRGRFFEESGRLDRWK
jgi:hypothetical protein